jgi:phosphoribosylanthranilate isomerase
VDVSSGVESAPGVKDAGHIREFIAAVRAADDSIEREQHEPLRPA